MNASVEFSPYQSKLLMAPFEHSLQIKITLFLYVCPQCEFSRAEVECVCCISSLLKVLKKNTNFNSMMFYFGARKSGFYIKL